MLRKTVISVLTTLVIASPLAAEEHYVLLLDTGYFPDYVYPTPGDTIRFYNQGELPMAATATDATWTTGLLQPGEEFILDVTEGMNQTYNDAVVDPATGALVETTGEVAQAAGVIDYINPAPVDLGADGKPLLLADEAYDQ